MDVKHHVYLLGSKIINTVCIYNLCLAESTVSTYCRKKRSVFENGQEQGKITRRRQNMSSVFVDVKQQ